MKKLGLLVLFCLSGSVAFAKSNNLQMDKAGVYVGTVSSSGAECSITVHSLERTFLMGWATSMDVTVQVGNYAGRTAILCSYDMENGNLCGILAKDPKTINLTINPTIRYTADVNPYYAVTVGSERVICHNLVYVQ